MNWSCEMCGNTLYRIIVRHPMETVVKCRACGLVQLLSIPEQIQNKDDFGHFNVSNYIDYMRGFREQQHEKDIEIIKKYASHGTLLDIGCSFGWFMDRALNAGFKAEGIEPSQTSVEWAKKQFPYLNILTGEFSPMLFAEREFDVVTLWSVLEHFLHPFKQLQSINSIMKKEGILVIRVPNYRSIITFMSILLFRLSFGKIDSPLRTVYLFDNDYKHFYHFSPKTLTKMLNLAFFEVLETRKEHSIDPRRLKLRAKIKDDKSDSYFSNPFVILGTRVILFFAKMLGLQDEMVIVAKKIKTYE